MKYTPKPAIVDGWQYNSNHDEIPSWLHNAQMRNKAILQFNGKDHYWKISTRQGDYSANIGDWILHDENANLSVWSNAAFNSYYSPVE